MELQGFAPVERATFLLYGSVWPDSLSVRLEAQDQAPAGMTRLSQAREPAPWLFGWVHFDQIPRIALDDYWLDTYEVTNRQYKEFVDRGGYQKQEYWRHEFRKDGRVVSWTDAVAQFRDKTGRPGPSTWEQGEYPKGLDDVPVSGVSWYEAAAYAEFVGKSLPTVYHWITAASAEMSKSIVPASNFGGQGLLRAGSRRGTSRYGIHDMAGNVKEWTWNDDGSGQRYVMSGSWDEPPYMFNTPDVRKPFDRSANLGFRCARYLEGGVAGRLADPVVLETRDYSREKPVSDDLFRVYRSQYAYDRTPLDSRVESVENAEEWTREKVSFAAAYGNERVTAYLFLPKKGRPLYQTVLYFPGGEVVALRSFEELVEIEKHIIGFLVKSGRAVMFPVYKGTFERGSDLTSYSANSSVTYRDHVIAWSKDLNRSIDYLETRPDIDRDRFAFVGLSWGAVLGSLLPALEPRIKVSVLRSGGFPPQKMRPEVDPINFAPRVTVPVLLLNGRFDGVLAPETSQLPLFELLGTPREHKRRVEFESGHDLPRHEAIRETLNWLERYLGPAN
jgi:dienelactone hydrolase